MSEKDDKTAREERLAAKLRENLRRRKTQARELRQPGDSTAEDVGETLSKSDSGR